MLEEKKVFYNCALCGKRLIQRLPNGVWKFLYGRNPKFSSRLHPPVEMYIHGSLKLRCLNDKCGHMNTFNYFPGTESVPGSIGQSPKVKSPEINNNNVVKED